MLTGRGCSGYNNFVSDRMVFRNTGVQRGMAPLIKSKTQRKAAVPHPDDLDLVHRVLNRERHAFDDFFEIYFPRLCRFVYARIDDDAAAEDIVQETLNKALKNLHTYRGEARLFTWLCQICRNEISNWFARHSNRQSHLVSLDDDPAIMAAMESINLDHEPFEDSAAQIQAVQLTLDNLPDRYAKALEWKYILGLSVVEIAERLNATELATQSLLARARSAFRTCYRDLIQEIA